MNCAEAKRCITSAREGEMSPEESRRLAGHLRTCPACAAERAAFLKQERALARLRSIVPEMKNPDASLQAILERVRREESRRGGVDAGSILDKLIALFETPRLRYVLAAFVIIMVTGFVIQQVTILRNVSALEARLSLPDAPRIRAAYVIPRSALDRLNRTREFRTVLERAGADRESGERIDAASLAAFAGLRDFRETREVVRALQPDRTESSIDSLVADLARHARFVLTYSKGVAVR